jgi:hypothetical protein
MTRPSRSALTLLLVILPACAQKPETAAGAGSMLALKRIYVAPLTGGPQADALRELIIASINSTRLFTLTDNPDRADAVLKGAADDHVYTDAFDTDSGLSSRQNGGKSSSGSLSSRATGTYLGVSISDNESHHIRERKHEAYASVRLCNKDGDVLWSTTQESQGAKFRSASADVAAKIAHQLTLDVNDAQRALSIAINSTAPATSHKP